MSTITDEDRFRLLGTRVPPAESRLLSAGPLSMTLEDGNLRTIRFMGHEVLRGISFLVRDKDWGTCAARIAGLQMEEQDAYCVLHYRATFTAPDGAMLTAHAHIAATAAGHLTFSASFTADRDFETARAGFTVLHPLTGVVGEPVCVEHGDGAVEKARWPYLIEPWQPFKDIRAITHRVAGDMIAETRFSGDVFEMEDQRNWTDGSFKTYVRPLALPWPYRIEAGKEIRQSVTLTITAEDRAGIAPSETGPVSLTFAETEVTLPAMGLGLRPECLEAERQAVPHLAALGIRHLLGHFDPEAGHGLEALRGFAEIAASAGLPVTLELALACKEEPLDELTVIAALCREAGLQPASLFVSPSVDRQSTPPGSAWPACPPLDAVYHAAREAFPGVALGGGMMSYFTELNRKRVPAERLDYLSHCTNPIVHAADDLSVMQSFEALSDVVRSVRAIWPGMPYRIGPSTIAMRQNPYGSATKDNPQGLLIPMANVDPRHNGQFGAAFAGAYAATVAPAGLDVLTLATLAGPFGLIAGEGEPSARGTLRPLARVLKVVSALSGKRLVKVTSSRPATVLGLATEDTLLLVNLTPQAQAVDLSAARTAQAVATLAPYDVLVLERTAHA
jgi:hypothetical protein